MSVPTLRRRPGPATDPSQLDPWAEQARRHVEHRRRRRRRWFFAGLGLVVVGALGAGAWWFLDTAREPGGEESPPDAAAERPSTPPPSTSTVPPTTVDPASLVRLADVWLLDRQDGTYDWGVLIGSTDDVDRGEVVVDVRLVGAAGAVVEERRSVVAVLPAGGLAAVAGSRVGAGPSPTRLEVDVAIGREVGLAGEHPTLDLLAVERRPGVGSDGRDDVLVGRIDSSYDDEVSDVVVAAVWRDAAGEVVAAVSYDVARVRPDVQARFEIPLDGRVVPDGPPDDVALGW